MKFDIDPQVAGEELEKIKGHNSGEISPEAVIKAAELPSSPLHKLFEWDDAKAARQQRAHVANSLIKAIVVTIVSDGPQEPQVLNVRVTAAEQPSGTADVRVLTDADLRAQRVERGWLDLDKWIKTYGALPEFAQVAGVLQVLASQRSKAA